MWFPIGYLVLHSWTTEYCFIFIFGINVSFSDVTKDWHSGMVFVVKTISSPSSSFFIVAENVNSASLSTHATTSPTMLPLLFKDCSAVFSAAWHWTLFCVAIWTRGVFRDEPNRLDCKNRAFDTTGAVTFDGCMLSPRIFEAPLQLSSTIIHLESDLSVFRACKHAAWIA